MDKRLAFLSKNSNDIFCVTDINGNIGSVNHSWVHSLGYSERRSKTMNLVALSHPEDKDRISELFNNMISLQYAEGVAVRIKKSNEGFLSINWSFCFDSDRQLVYAVGIYSHESLNVHSLYNISDKVQHVLANLSEGFLMLDARWHINAFNPAFQQLVKMQENELYGADFRQIDKLMLADEVIPQFDNVYKTQVPATLQYYDSYYKGWLRLHIYPYKGELVIFIRDVSNFKIEQLMLSLEKSVLQTNFIPGYPLSKIAEELLIGIEEIFPEMYCSILELDAAQEKIYHLSAPRLPRKYCSTINGQKIGPRAGSCGTAAYYRKQIIVTDINSSPLWDDYKEYVLPYGFKACWSTPVISAQSTNVLATFAIYYDTAREPGKDEQTLINRTVNILRVLIESKRHEAYIAEQTRRLHEIATISSHSIRRPVASIIGLVSLFDKENPTSPLNTEVMRNLQATAYELDEVIRVIVGKTESI